jgi:Transposase protein
VATHDVEGRVLASLGKGGPAASRFEPCADVPKAGVLVALPALLASGLWEQTEEHFQLPQGYYQLVHLFLLVAFLALARVKSLESLRYCAPGEWGKVLGLDRIPEVRTLREKLQLLGQEKKVAAWAAQLSQRWMAEDPQSAGTLYVDGHVRPYHGSAARLPKHYVPRQRLCLRATTDYWVNALDGKPFFVVHQPVDPGLLQVLEEEIVPRLEKEVPHQPTAQELAADPKLDKFLLVFDREGYSPQALQRFKERRIGCLTYHKYPGPDWPAEEFQLGTVPLVHGNQEQLKLAERRTVLSNGFAVREVRCLEETGHQTSVLATADQLSREAIAAAMFARWSQENFLKYMREHYALDRLLSHQVEPMDETTKVVNPAWRKLDRMVRSLAAKLPPKLARFGAMSLPAAIEPEAMEKLLQKKAALQQDIEQIQTQLQKLKTQRANLDHHLPLGQVPQSERFDRLSSGSKDLVDTIKLVAYRAETAMAQVVREALPHWRQDEERRLLQSLYGSEADLIPNEAMGTLTVRLHYPANAMLAGAVQKLCAELTATETVFPTTKLRLVYLLADGRPVEVPANPLKPAGSAHKPSPENHPP